MKWRTIDSAPTNQPVLVWCGWNEDVTIGYFWEDYWTNKDNWSVFEPTHWMPLPEGPK